MANGRSMTGGERVSRRRFLSRSLAGTALGLMLATARPQTLGSPSVNAIRGSRSQRGVLGSVVAQSSQAKLVMPGLASDGPGPVPTVREMIGAMVMTGFPGLSLELEHPIVRDISNGHLGGVILFDHWIAGESMGRNIASPWQLAELTTQIQGLAPTEMLVAVDQEGGTVARLNPTNHFSATVSPADLGQIDDPEVTYTTAGQLAKTLQEAGINLNLAPVVDLNINPNNPIIGSLGRSFSVDPQVVIRNARAFIEAHHDRGVLCTLKHFPGHGSSEGDSHLGFVDITHTWSDVELEPFAVLIAEGLADVVMTGHVFNSDLDPTYPATLSYEIVTGLLRDRLGYKGVVISDAMEMAAVSENYGFDTMVQLAIEAGVDILLFTNNVREDGQDVVTAVVDLVEGLIESGTMTETRIVESFDRIRLLKARL